MFFSRRQAKIIATLIRESRGRSTLELAEVFETTFNYLFIQIWVNPPMIETGGESETTRRGGEKKQSGGVREKRGSG